MLRKATHLIHRAAEWCVYLAFRARRGYGLPRSRQGWENQYAAGRWDYLDSPAELPHYMVAVGYVRQFAERPSVLDLGCGHGRLLQLLQAYPLGRYLGLDISEEAVRRAGLTAPAGADFVVGDFEQFAPPQPFDVIIFNECLYYARDPAAVMRRYAGSLAPGGVMVVSMCYNWWQYPIWHSLASRFVTLNATAVTNERKQTWHVRVLRERAPGLVATVAERRQADDGRGAAAASARRTSVMARVVTGIATRISARTVAPLHIRLAVATVAALVAALTGYALAEAIEVFG